MRAVIGLDLFCGAGGTSSGFQQACDEQGIPLTLTVVNHWPIAIKTHETNHPKVKHLCTGVDNVNFREIAPLGQMDVLWASPECFTASTTVLTARGIIPISDVQVNDYVLTHKGRWRRVVRTFQSKADTCVVKGYGHYGLETTPNHPFYTKHPVYRYPGRKNDTGKRPGKVRTFENPSWVKASNVEGKWWATPITSERIPFTPPPVELNKELFYWLGRWLGDGSSNKGDFEICFGYHEFSQAVSDVHHTPIRRLDGQVIKPRFRELPTAGVISWGFESLVQWVASEFGKGAGGKTVPAWMFSVQREWQEAFLVGYLDADGSDEGRRVSAATKSKSLAIGIRILASMLGFNPGLSKQKQRSSKVGDRVIKGEGDYYVVYWTKELKHNTTDRTTNHLFLPVREVKQGRESQPVFNLQVEEDESYIADGIVVHNCTHHSVARGGKPINDQSRATAWCVVRAADALMPRDIIVENVPEFQDWGPTMEKPVDNPEYHPDGKDLWSGSPRINIDRPDPKRKGRIFQAWVETLRAMGYRVEWKVLCAADYGDPTTRRRLFVRARRDNGEITWPKRTHAPVHEAAELGCLPWVAAARCIDWDHRGTSIYHRKRPLSPKTMKRIAAGLHRFVLKPLLEGGGDGNKPFLVKLRGTNTVADPDKPAPTITAGGTHLGLDQPYLIQLAHSGGDRVKDVKHPLPTVCGNRGDMAVISPYLVSFDNGSNSPGAAVSSASSPLSTIVTKARHAVAQPFLVKFYGSGGFVPITSPIATVTTKDRFGLVVPKAKPTDKPDIYELDILFRMLTPRELARAQGFPDDYEFVGTKTEAVKQIGNAVPVNTAKALINSALKH